MKTIWKYALNVSRQEVEMPAGAKPLSVGMQAGEIMLWALVDPERPAEKRVFRFYGTGHGVESDAGAFIGTVQDGNFVWHVFKADL